MIKIKKSGSSTTMRYQVKTIVQAIAYLLSKLPGETDKIKIVKLLYQADKYSLTRYCRTVTGDTVRHRGGSFVQNLLEKKSNNITPNEKKYFASLMERQGDIFKTRNAKCDFEMLSETDKKSLSETARIFRPRP